MLFERFLSCWKTLTLTLFQRERGQKFPGGAPLPVTENIEIEISRQSAVLLKNLFFCLLLSTQACAIVAAPFQTQRSLPKLHLEISHSLPSKLVLNFRAESVQNMEGTIVIYRALGDAEFSPWKTIAVRDFEAALLDGLRLIDSTLAYNQPVAYVARVLADEKEVLSRQVSFQKKEGPSPPEDIVTAITDQGIRISWRPSTSFSHVIVYRRNLLEDSPMEIISDLVKGEAFQDEPLDAGVYTYQLVALTSHEADPLAYLEYGPLSEPVYITLDPDVDGAEKVLENKVKKEMN